MLSMKWTPVHRRIATTGVTVLSILSSAALADTINVVTSFPKELTTAYKAAYEKKYPNDKVEILNKNTTAGLAFVREQPAGSRGDRRGGAK